ncbi:MAG: hypothetical protein WC979_03605 [Candidatus Pacearchaeota archaeon]|jgi:DNA-directed RNA polymerase subunit D
MIKIKNSNEKEQKLSFVTDMSSSLANAVRRSSLEIPIMAIDEIEIHKNDSALYDEIIAHRLGLVPIKTDKTSKEQKFKLKAVGPRTVYSTEITPSVETDYKLPIVILDKDQELEIVADANLGKGVDHIKYSPGLIYYKHDIDPELIDFVSVDEDGKITYDEADLKERLLPEELMSKIKKLKEANEIIFEIESWGQLKAKDIFLRAIEALDENLEQLDKALK